MYYRKSRMLQCDSFISLDLEVMSAVLCINYTAYPIPIWLHVLYKQYLLVKSHP